MFIYKIIGILLMSSPITIYTEIIYFPYSFLGLTLFFLVMLFSSKKHFPIVDFYLFLGVVLAMLLHKPISYQLFLIFFILYQYIVAYIKIHSRFLNFLILLGFILSSISIFVPIVYTINVLLLALTMILNYRNLKKSSKKQLEQQFGQDFDLDDEAQEIIIPLASSEHLIQEKEYVIPIQDKE